MHRHEYLCEGEEAIAGGLRNGLQGKIWRLVPKQRDSGMHPSWDHAGTLAWKLYAKPINPLAVSYLAVRVPVKCNEGFKARAVAMAMEIVTVDPP